MEENQNTGNQIWLTIDEAFAACQTEGLDRTKKTVRQWCRNEHVEARKQTSPTGERWVIDKASLLVKIRSELAFQAQHQEVRTRSDQVEPVQTGGEPVHTRADRFEHERTGAEGFEPGETTENTRKIAELEAQVRSLEIDKAVRDRHVEFLTRQNDEGQKNLLGQSRYIGHLETEVFKLGGKTNQSFLAPPTVRQEAQNSEPDESRFYAPQNQRLSFDQ